MTFPPNVLSTICYSFAFITFILLSCVVFWGHFPPSQRRHPSCSTFSSFAASGQTQINLGDDHQSSPKGDTGCWESGVERDMPKWRWKQSWKISLPGNPTNNSEYCTHFFLRIPVDKAKIQKVLFSVLYYSFWFTFGEIIPSWYGLLVCWWVIDP